MEDALSRAPSYSSDSTDARNRGGSLQSACPFSQRPNRSRAGRHRTARASDAGNGGRSDFAIPARQDSAGKRVSLARGQCICQRQRRRERCVRVARSLNWCALRHSHDTEFTGLLQHRRTSHGRGTRCARSSTAFCAGGSLVRDRSLSSRGKVSGTSYTAHGRTGLLCSVPQSTRLRGP